MHAPDELGAWLRLSLSPGIGPVAAGRLLEAFGSAAQVLAAGPAAWQELGGPACAAALAREPAELAKTLRAAQQWLAAEPERRAIISLNDPAYPSALREVADPPILLYAMGQLDLLTGPAVALVGSRQATQTGLDLARQLARQLSQRGMTVVSGLALGIDGAAHEGALEGPGKTIAVLGTGLDRIYPRRHLELAHRLADQGLLLSEFHLGTAALPAHFPRRNRIIAGLSLATVVVEASFQSGSLITARLALEDGREVCAVPGSVLSAQSKGCHWLIRQGATLVETADDIMQALPPWVLANAVAAPGAEPRPEPPDSAKWPRRNPGARPRTAAPAPAQQSLPLNPTAPANAASAADLADPVLSAMSHEALTLDSLGQRCGWPADLLLARLLELELDGKVARLPGGLLQRRGLA